jgi:bifunctional non-homologous end joining protein LigD
MRPLKTSVIQSMSLREYQRKRDFRRTSEPLAKVAKRKGWSYVIQKHAASHLHYDFRLELDGVLKSWAVPKGPSLDPKVKRLAMHVEDHPVNYGEFEGIIPAGEYGGGTVMLWDRGSWEPVGDPHEGHRTGRLKFRLQGEKLRGGWMLVKSSRSASGKGNEWLLFKERDEEAQPATDGDIVVDQPLSVTTGRDLDQIASDQDHVWKSNRVSSRAKGKATRAMTRKAKRRKSVPVSAKLAGAKRAAMPRRIDVKLATLVKDAPEGDQWFHEIKFDGYRIIAHLDGGKVEFNSRNHKSWTKRLAPLAGHVNELPAKQAILDGEVVTFKKDGTTDFQALQNAFSEGKVSNLVYYVFDLLYLDGMDLRTVPLEDRKQLLEKLLPVGQSGPVRYSEHFVGNGPQFFRQASELKLEGIICKLRDRPYTSGRGPDWLKVKALQREEFVIGGFTDPGNRKGFGALLLGYHDKQHRLHYAGKVGTGFSEKLLASLRQQLDELRQDESPFSDLRKTTGEARGALWVRPQLVGQVAFTEWTDDGHLRHPAFLGLREDKAANMVVRDVVGDTAQATNGVAKKEKTRTTKTASQFIAGGSDDEGTLGGVRLTSPNKLLYAKEDITKLELAQYYLSVARWMLPHVANRPLSLVRCPEGTGGECFFQKHPGIGTPKDLRRVPVKEKGKLRNYLVADEVEDLIALAQIGALEIHVWGSRADKLELPDRMIFDLDPDPAVPWPRVVESAQHIRRFLEEIGLESFVKTTGGKGLHIVVPLERRSDWDEVKAFSKHMAELVEQADPNHYVSNMSKAKRKGKIFIDYLRNGRGATAICAFSTRAKPHATVSVPLSWDELTPAIHSDQFTIRNLAERLNSLRKDPWAKIGSVKQSLTKSVKKKVGFAG